jgi:hypothetical protein
MSVEIPAIPQGVAGNGLIAHLNDRLRRISQSLGTGATGATGAPGPPGFGGGVSVAFAAHALSASPLTVLGPGMETAGSLQIVTLMQDATGGRALPTFATGTGAYASDTALRIQDAPINFSGDASSVTILIFVAIGAGSSMRWVLSMGASGGSAV